MKIIDKSVMPNGTRIQLEDWRDPKSDSDQLYDLMIGAYPIAKRTGKYETIKKGRTFRLSISQNYDDGMIVADYIALKNGVKRLEDLSDHFWNEEKDMWYLGMDVPTPFDEVECQ